MPSHTTPCQSPEPTTTTSNESSKGALLITTLSLSILSDPQCPICHEPYIEPPTPTQPPSSDTEWAVRVDMIAEWFGTKRCCGHIIGRSCLEKHLEGPGAWRNKCPLCRDVWFHDVVPRDVQGGVGESSVRGLRRSQRIAARRDVEEGGLSGRYGVGQGQRSQRARRRPTRFTQRLLAALQAEDGSNEVKGTMEEVERRLKTLY